MKPALTAEEWSEVTAFLKEDAEKLRAYVFGSERPHKLMLEKA